MVLNSFKYSIQIFFLFFIIVTISFHQSEAASQKFIPRNNPLEDLIVIVDKKMITISYLLQQIEQFKEYAHWQELEKLNDEFISGTEKKNEVEKGMGQIKYFIDTVTNDSILNDKSSQFILKLNTFRDELDEKIDEMTVFINKFNQILQNKKRVLKQMNSTSKELSVTRKKLKNIQNKVDANTLCTKLLFAEKKQETARNEFENNNIQLALNHTIKVRNIVEKIHYKICNIEKNEISKKQVLNFLLYTDDMLEYFKNNKIKNASPLINNKFNTAWQTQKNAYLIIGDNPDAAMDIAREARHLILDLNGFYLEDMDDNDTITVKQQVLFRQFEKVTSSDTVDISWNTSTSGNVFYNMYPSDQYINTNNDMSLENSKLDSSIEEYDISGYFMTSLKWRPNIPIIQILEPKITVSQSQCNIGNDITLEFLNNLLTVNNILRGTLFLDQEIKDSSNSVFCEIEVEIQKNFPIFSFYVNGDIKIEEFIFPRIGYVPFKKYSFNTDYNFNTKDLSKSFLIGFTYAFNDYYNSYNSDFLERDNFFYKPSFEICFWNNTNSLIIDGFYNWEIYKNTQIASGYLNPVKIQCGKLEACMLSHPLQWLNIELRGEYNFENTLIRDKQFNLSISDSITNLISKENQYLHTYSLSPDFTIKPYSNIGLGLLFEYEGQKFKITPEIDTLHTLKSYYAIMQGMKLFYESNQSFFQIAYNFKINNIMKRGEYNNESSFWELKLPFKWNWNPFEWFSFDLETEFCFRKKNKKKIQKFKPEKYYSISLNCGVRF